VLLLTQIHHYSCVLKHYDLQMHSELHTVLRNSHAVTMRLSLTEIFSMHAVLHNLSMQF